ncbi:unnamed protein product [Prunus brigantina]
MCLGCWCLTSISSILSTPFKTTASFGFTEEPLDKGLDSPLTRFQMDVSGQLRQFTWATQTWNMFWSQPENKCRVFGLCGAFGVRPVNASLVLILWMSLVGTMGTTVVGTTGWLKMVSLVMRGAMGLTKLVLGAMKVLTLSRIELLWMIAKAHAWKFSLA